MRIPLFALGLCMIASTAIAQTSPNAAVAWFTDAAVEDAVKTATPPNALAPAPGTEGKGVQLTHAVAIENPVLRQDCGMIAFWIKPEWAGNDGKTHRILRIGDPKTNGLLLEKSEENMLRFVMASPKKSTASRADVSGWKKGEWHHIAIIWMSVRGKPIGLPLWIDKVCVDGPIVGGNEFLNPKTMNDDRLWIGDDNSECVIDELIMRNVLDTPDQKGQTGVVYREYFRTAPYSAVAITHEACEVPSDKRVVNGHEKQFGMKAKYGDQWVSITNFEIRYGPWAEFDAKPFIKWATSDEAIATVDQNGLVAGKSVGKCKLTGEYRGLKDTYDITVISVEQPDLDLIQVEMLPRYKWSDLKDRPAAGDRMTSVARIMNMGFEDAPAGTVVRFELIPDANENFRCDVNEKAVYTKEVTIDKAMAPRDEVKLEFKWDFPEKPTWIRVTVDPENKIGELCEANNQVCELSTARPIRLALSPKERDREYNEKQINHVGSFSLYDWVNSEKLRCDKMVRESVGPETSPVGIQDAYRTDRVYELQLGEWEKEPYNIDEPYYDGGFPINEEIHRMNIDIAIIHEFGHCVLSQPDLYAYPVHASSVLLKDASGQPYAGGDLMPLIREREDVVPFSKAIGVPCGVGYHSLMNDCHLWMDPSQSGHVQWYRGIRGDRFWGTQGRLMATRRHYLRVYDIEDKPLAGAAIYVYGVTNTGARDAGTMFFADRPKFMGNTDSDGRFLFPGETDENWDDPDTDVFEGAWQMWNPFGRAKSVSGTPADTAFTPNVWGVEGIILIKIVKGDQTEFVWMSMTDFNTEFFRGSRITATYDTRTSLKAGPGVTEIVKTPLPDAMKKQNLAPIAKVAGPEEITIKCGETLKLDGSASADPEGQPLLYRWILRGDRAPDPSRAETPTYTGVMPKEPTELEVVFFVIDGYRASECKWLKVHVVR